MILVAGGTGTLGSTLVPLLLDAGHSVRVLTRQADAAAGLVARGVHVVVGTVEDAGDADRAVRGCSCVISAMSGFGPTSGTTPEKVDLAGNGNLLRAAVESGAGHFIMVSMHGAAPDHMLGLARLKYRFEQELVAGSVPWTIVRPTVLTESLAGVLAAPLQKTGMAVIFGSGEPLVNFVSVRDVAAVLLRAVEDPAFRGMAIDVGGPENLTMNQFVAALRAKYGISGATIHVQLRLLRTFIGLPRLMPAGVNRGLQSALYLARDGHYFDADPLRVLIPEAAATTVSQALARI